MPFANARTPRSRGEDDVLQHESSVLPLFVRIERKTGTRQRLDTMTNENKQPQDIVTLYRRAFAEYGASALWSSKPVAEPTADDAMAITRSLRVEGDLRARGLAEQIERACNRAPI